MCFPVFGRFIPQHLFLITLVLLRSFKLSKMGCKMILLPQI